jgi:site-specific recombinase XerD
MNLLQQFIISLLNQKNTPSLSTLKNYKADIGQFVKWLEGKFGILFNPINITSQILYDYKKSKLLSPASMKRHDSSLRKFFGFLKNEGIIRENLLEKKVMSVEALAREDPWKIKNFKNFLYEGKKSSLTIKNYINDIKNFFLWLDEVALAKHSYDIADRNLIGKISLSVIEEYKQRLITAKYSPLTINRKLSSLRVYLSWIKEQGLIPSKPVLNHAEFISTSQSLPEKNMSEVPIQTQSDNTDYSPFPPKRLTQKITKGINFLFDNLFVLPLSETIEFTRYSFWKVTGKNIFKKNLKIKSSQSLLDQSDKISNIKKGFYAPLDISIRYLPIPNRTWHHIRYTRPNWYKRYHSYAFTHYLHFAILTILCCTISFGIYNEFFTNKQGGNVVLGTATSASSRILSFQGKLSDSSETPIIKETTVHFSLYADEKASPEANLWQEDNIVKPDSNGAFSILLGKNNPILDSAFSQNPRLFLGIAIENSLELQPRQELATVFLAKNAETLQGLEPITNTSRTSNAVLALDSSGNLSIAGDKTHVFQTIGGNFVLSGKVLSLTTIPGSNSNIEIVPDGMGKIDLSKPIQNSSDYNNLTAIAGAVEFDDMVAILATTSAQATLYINQNSTGTLISANTNQTAKFTVENDGSGMFAGNLGINGSYLSSTATTFNLLNSTVTTLNIGGAATTLNLGVKDGSTIIKSNLVLSSLSSNGGLLYTNDSGKIFQTPSGSSSDCLTGGSNPSFTSCLNILSQANRIGIGTTTPTFKLDVWDSQDATASARIYNTSTSENAIGLIVRLGNASSSAVPSTNRFIDFETDGIGTVGSVRGNNTGGVSYITYDMADFAEYLKKDKNHTIEYGSVVCLDNNGLAVKCSSSNKIIGIASEHPAFLGGKNLGDNSIAVGLIGQIETLVVISNEGIKSGDMLTASEIPGIATKATKAGQVVGKALENLTITDEAKIVGFYDPDSKEYRSKANFPNIPLKGSIIRIAKVPVLVNISWYDPQAYLAQSGNLILNTKSNDYSVFGPNGETLIDTEGFWKVVAANIKAGLINASETITNALIVTSDSIIINGQNLKDYIVDVIKDSGIIGSDTISPIVNTNQISTNIISPLSSPDLIVKLATPSGSLIVKNTSGSAVARIDNQGNASFSGTINSLALKTDEASISGTLRAGSIIADSILGLDAKISNIYSNNYVSLASYSAQLSDIPNFTAQTGQFNQGLMVFGPTSLSDLSIAGVFSIGGTMFVTGNSIETLGADLSIQSLRQGGLSVMNGLVYVDTQGNVKIQGDLSVTGKLAVNIISPLSTSNLLINNASGSSVLSINQTGDVIASGSGTFAKLNLNFIEPVLAISSTEVMASSSAGVTKIAPYQSEVTIKNPLVTNKSVIYITPVGTPSAQTPFLMRQNLQGGAFTVGVQSPTNHPIDFNWLIVN